MSETKLLVPANTTLRPSQVEAVQLIDKFLNLPVDPDRPVKGIFNGSDPGTGKTCMTIASLNLQDSFRSIIIAPTSVKYKWANEITTWSTHQRKTILVCDTGKDLAKASDYNFVIVSPGLLYREDILYFIYRKPFHSLVIDESTCIKSPTAKLTSIIRKYFVKKCKHLYCLSGTGITKDVGDVWPPFSMIDPFTFGDKDVFLNRYSNTYTQMVYYRGRSFPQVKYQGAKNEIELNQIIRSRFYLRYTLEQVAPEMPEKNWIEIQIPDKSLVKTKETEEALAEYNKECSRAWKHIDHPEGIDSIEADASLRALEKAHAVNAAKKAVALQRLPAILEFTEELLVQGEAVVLFAYHLEVIRQIEEYFAGRVDFRTITGATSGRTRQDYVDQFQAGEYPLFIGQIKACGHSITLTKAKLCVMAELDWSPSSNEQAAARIARIGQLYPTLIYYFTVPGAPDANLLRKLAEKASISNKILDTDLAILKHTKKEAGKETVTKKIQFDDKKTIKRQLKGINTL